MMNHFHNISHLGLSLYQYQLTFRFSVLLDASLFLCTTCILFSSLFFFDVGCRIAIEHEWKKNSHTRVQKKHCEQNEKAELGSI